MSGFANGLLAGSGTASRWVDAYNTASDREERAAQLAEQKAIMGAQPTEVQGFSAGQGELLRQAAAAGNEIGWDDATKSYAIKDPGSESATPVRPQAMTHFLGDAREGSLTPAQANQMRYGALGRSLMARDPIKGAQTALLLDKMGEADVADEEAKAYKVKEAEFYKNLASMPFQDMVKLAGGAINPDGEIGAMITYDPDSKNAYLASTIPGLPDQKVSRVELMNIVGSAFREGKGDLNAGVKGMLAQMAQMQSQHGKLAEMGGRVALAGARTENVGNQITNRNERTDILRGKADDDAEFRQGVLNINAARARTDAARGASTVDVNTARADKLRSGVSAVTPVYTKTEETERKALEGVVKDAAKNQDQKAQDEAMAKIRRLDDVASTRGQAKTMAARAKKEGMAPAQAAEMLQSAGYPKETIQMVVQAMGGN